MSKLKHIEKEELIEVLNTLHSTNLELQELIKSLSNYEQINEAIESLKGQVISFDKLINLANFCTSEEACKETRRLSFMGLSQAKMGTDIIIAILNIKAPDSMALSKAKEYHYILEDIVNNLMVDYRGKK